MTNTERLLRQATERQSESLAIDDIERAGFDFDQEAAQRGGCTNLESIQRLAVILLMEAVDPS
jgi:hypothetical protein